MVDKKEEIFKFGKRIRLERERLGYTQADIGGFLGATGRTIAKYESGETEPKLRHLLELHLLGADIDYIITGSSYERSERLLALINAEHEFIFEAIKCASSDELELFTMFSNLVLKGKKK